MALRLANKIHSLVNNVVLRSAPGVATTQHHLVFANQLSSKIAALQSPESQSAPKTRYPLNQQDANTYIERLRMHAFLHNAVNANEPNVVRTFNVNLHSRRRLSGSLNACRAVDECTKRFMSSKKGGKKNKDCMPLKIKKEKCPKLKPTTCPTFKLANCKPTKNFVCTKRPYHFTDCKKRPAPYPSFSEACYEDPYHTDYLNECRDCPYNPDRHPTYQAPPVNDKYQPPIRRNWRRFHTDARHFVTLKFGDKTREEEATERRTAEMETLYGQLNEALFDAKNARKMRRLKQTPTVTKVSPIPRTLAMDTFAELTQLKNAAQSVAPLNADRMNMLLRSKYSARRSRDQGKGTYKRHPLGSKRRHKMNKKKPDRCKRPCKKVPFTPDAAYNYKDREIKPPSNMEQDSTCECAGHDATAHGMLCKMKKIDESKAPRGLECEEIEKSPVCPKTLLDRKPYPKYRKAMKKRLKKEKDLEKKRRAKRGSSKKPKKKAASVAAAGTERDEDGACFGQVMSEFDVDAPHQFDPRPIRPHSMIRRHIIRHKVVVPKAVARSRNSNFRKQFAFRPLPEEQEMDEYSFLAERDEQAKAQNELMDDKERFEKTLETIENMIMAKSRVRVTGPPACPEACTTSETIKKKKCHKKPKVRICPTDLLDRKPYKKLRDKKKKSKKHHRRSKRSSHKGKRAAGISEEELTALATESQTPRSSRPSV